MNKTFLLIFLLITHLNLYAQVRIEHDTSMGLENSVLQIDSDTYLVAYIGDSDDGFIKTFTVTADGSSITQVAVNEIDPYYYFGGAMIQVDSDTYLIAYAGDGADGYMTTVGITSSGLISSPLWITGDAGFRMLSSPVSGQVLGNLLTNAWTQGMTGGDFTNGNANVWTFNVSEQSWSALSDISGSGTSIATGQGFLTYIFADNNNDGTDDLPITLSVSGSENSGSVTYPSSGSITIEEADKSSSAGIHYRIADLEESGSLSLTFTSTNDQKDVAWFSFTED